MTTVSPERRLALSQKLALASGVGATLAGFVAPQSADATPIQSTTLPKSPPSTAGIVYWDVDGDGTNDFVLSNSTGYGAARLFDAVNGGATTPVNDVLVNGQLRLAGVPQAMVIGNATTLPWFNQAGAVVVTYQGTAAQFGGDTVPYFGFKFTNGTGVHYGWGQLSVTGSPVGAGFSITQAYYESVAGASIQVGDTVSPVPEIDPASAGSVLSLVVGSLAMLERRRSRRSAEASA